MDRRSEAYANQYAFNDFGIRQVALLMNKTADVTTFTNRSLVSWNETVRHASVPTLPLVLQERVGC